MCVYDIKSEHHKKNHIMCQSSVNLIPCCIKYTSNPCGTKVPRLNMCRSILSITERTVGVEIGGDREGVGQNLKKEGRQYRGSS